MKVLVVDDERCYWRQWQEELPAVKIIGASSAAEAEEKFSANEEDIIAVVLDGSLSLAGHLDTLPLVEVFRRTFKGPIIAASGCTDYREQLVEAGCDHEIEKNFVARLLRDIILSL